MSDARLVAHQLRYDLLVVWRDPQSRFFTIVLPLIFLVLLTSLFGNHTRSRRRPRDQELDVLRAGHLHPRDHRDVVREPRDHDHRAARERRAQAAPLDPGARRGC